MSIQSSVDTATSEALNNVYRMVMEGDVTGASMMAQEVLSDIFGQWRRISHDASGSDNVRLAGSLLLASTAYAETLLKQRQPKAAYNATMTALAYTARVEEVDAGARLMAMLTSWAAVEQILTATAPSDAAQCEAIRVVAAGMATLLYRQYYIVGKTDPENKALPDAYHTLRVLQSLVDIDPSPSDPLQLFARVLNASQAAGILE